MPVVESLHSLVSEAIQRLKNRTPTPPVDDDMPDNSSKAECQLLRSQRWGGENKKLVERQRREKIQDPHYWKREVGFMMSIFDKKVSSATLPQLRHVIDKLGQILLDLGVPSDDVENERFEVPETDSLFWNQELNFWRYLKEETERSNQGNEEDSKPAQPTRTPPLPKQSQVPAPHSNSRSPSPIKGVQGARVQKKRFHIKTYTQKNRGIQASKQQKSSSPREEELSPTVPAKPVSGGKTMARITIDEEIISFAPWRAKNKKAVDSPHDSAGVQNPTRTRQKKPASKTRKYNLRSSSISAA